VLTSLKSRSVNSSRAARMRAEFPETIRWIRSCVVQEDDGRLGTACVYEARDAETVREHAGRVGMPADEVLAIADTVIVRSDPVASSAS
jgi:hypothetical protein